MSAAVSARPTVPMPHPRCRPPLPPPPRQGQGEHLNFYYGQKRALSDISIEMRANVVTAFIGPSGCGKSTFLRTLNRMNDIVPGTRVEGRVTIDDADIYAPAPTS